MEGNAKQITMDFIENRDISKKLSKWKAHTSILLQQMYSVPQE